MRPSRSRERTRSGAGCPAPRAHARRSGRFTLPARHRATTQPVVSCCTPRVLPLRLERPPDRSGPASRIGLRGTAVSAGLVQPLGPKVSASCADAPARPRLGRDRLHRLRLRTHAALAVRRSSPSGALCGSTARRCRRCSPAGSPPPPQGASCRRARRRAEPRQPAAAALRASVPCSWIEPERAVRSRARRVLPRRQASCSASLPRQRGGAHTRIPTHQVAATRGAGTSGGDERSSSRREVRGAAAARQTRSQSRPPAARDLRPFPRVQALDRSPGRELRASKHARSSQARGPSRRPCSRRARST